MQDRTRDREAAASAIVMSRRAKSIWGCEKETERTAGDVADARHDELI